MAVVVLSHIDGDAKPVVGSCSLLRQTRASIETTHSPLCSSLNKKLANALQISVFPVPVAPNIKNEATGRLRFCKPARDVLTASAIAVTTWSCPTTRARNASSIYNEDKTYSTRCQCRFRSTTHMYELLLLAL